MPHISGHTVPLDPRLVAGQAEFERRQTFPPPPSREISIGALQEGMPRTEAGALMLARRQLLALQFKSGVEQSTQEQLAAMTLNQLQREMENIYQRRPDLRGKPILREEQQEKVQQEVTALEEAAEVDIMGAEPPTPTGFEIPSFPAEDPPPGFEWRWNPNAGRYEPRKVEEERKELGYATEVEASRAAGAGQIAIRDDRTGRWYLKTDKKDIPPGLFETFSEAEKAAPEGFRPARRDGFWGYEREPTVSPFQERGFGIQQQQLQFQREQAQQQVEMQRQQERARLAANPMSWLQYASFTGADPLTQQWMVPLGMQQAQVGQPIPGFEGQQGQQIQTFANLPQLTTPSAQLQARWGPTAQAQFLGYRQARTGATPQETQFRLGSGRAPTGRFQGFSRFR